MIDSSCAGCGDTLDPIHEDGLFWDGDEIRFPCGTLNMVSCDSEGGYMVEAEDGIGGPLEGPQDE